MKVLHEIFHNTRFFPNPLSSMFNFVKTRREIKNSKKVKIIVGASSTSQTGWLSTNRDILNITSRKDWDRLLEDKKVHNVLAEHVLEHLTFNEVNACLRNIGRKLAKNGVFRVAVPDGYHPSKYVRELVKPNGLEPGAETHKVLFNIDIMKELAKEHGFTLAPLEYFDQKGYLHSTEIDTSNGYVKRSSKNYEGRFTNNVQEYEKMLATTPEHLRDQFIENNFSYTSLIVDFINKE